MTGLATRWAGIVGSLDEQRGGVVKPPAVGTAGNPQPPVRHSQDLRFDGLTKLAVTTLNVPFAQVSFAGFDRPWFRARYGVDAPAATGDAARLCAEVVASGEPLVVPDISADDRFAGDRPMIGDRPAHCYAGVPLRTPDGVVLGAFWVGDHASRPVTPKATETLALLAGQVIEILELHRSQAAMGIGQDAEDLKTEFVSMVSHELRTPLTTIRGALGLVAKGVTGTLPEQAQEYVDIALVNSERLARLINDILDAETIRSGTVELKMRVASLAVLIGEAVQQSKAYADSLAITLAFADRTPDVDVMVDEDRLRQVLEKLICNAAKFSEPGQSVELSMVADETSVRVTVRDHGRGISPDFRPCVFERFRQEDSSANREKDGSGLSLHIAKVLIEGMNGTMAFEPTPGGGTTFYFDLPVMHQRSALVPTGESDVHESGASQQATPVRVLYVEDDRDLQQIVRRLLPMEWAFTTATNLAEGRALLDAHVFDLVLLDLALPDGDGETLLDHAGAAQVVLFSASEAAPALVGRVTSALVKSRTKEFELRDHVLALMSMRDARGATE